MTFDSKKSFPPLYILRTQKLGNHPSSHSLWTPEPIFHLFIYLLFVKERLWTMCNSINRLWTLLCYVCIGDCWDGDSNNFPSPGTSHGAWTHEIFSPFGFPRVCRCPGMWAIGSKMGIRSAALWEKGEVGKWRFVGLGEGWNRERHGTWWLAMGAESWGMSIACNHGCRIRVRA